MTLRIIVDIYTAHLTSDITLALRGRIKIAAFQRGVTVAGRCAICNLLARGFTHDDGAPPFRLAPIANAGHAPQADAGTLLTEVELTWLEGRHRALGPLRSRRGETILDCPPYPELHATQRLWSLAEPPTTSTPSSRASTSCVRSTMANLSDQMVFFVRLGGDILLRIRGWPKVEQALQAIDAVEALSINPADAGPDHWRNLHNRLLAGEPSRRYSREQHRGWLLRRTHAGADIPYEKAKPSQAGSSVD